MPKNKEIVEAAPQQNFSSRSEEEKERAVSETRVVISFPDKLELKMVQANELKHYELFQWLAGTLLLPIAVGFWTAYFTLDVQSKPLLWSAAIFTLVALLFIGFAISHRRKVFHGSVHKSVELKDFR